MQADNSDKWTCRKCGVSFTLHGFVQHVVADACKLPRLPYRDNGRARACQHAGGRSRR